MAETNLPPEEQAAYDAKVKRDEAENAPRMGKGGDDDSGDDDESEDVEPPRNPDYKSMFQAEVAREYLGKSWMVFSCFFAIYYIIQFGLALACANAYSQSHELRLTKFDYDFKETTLVEDPSSPSSRMIVKTKDVSKTNEPMGICGPGVDQKAQLKQDVEAGVIDFPNLPKSLAGSVQQKLEIAQRQVSAQVYDTAFLLMGIFHIIEWLRTLVLLTSTVMGGVFLLVIYQITAINAIFGFVAYVFAHYALFNEQGNACSEKQRDRSQFLFAEIIFFYVLYGVSILFVLAFPKMAPELRHGAWRRREAKRQAEREASNKD